MIAYCGIDCAKCPAYSFPRLGEKLHMKGFFQFVLKSRMKPKPEGYVICDGCTAIDARCVQQRDKHRRSTLRGLAGCPASRHEGLLTPPLVESERRSLLEPRGCCASRGPRAIAPQTGGSSLRVAMPDLVRPGFAH